MVQHYLKSAWRSLVKNKSISLIHLCGLSGALATCLMLGLYLTYELRFDRFHQKGDRICRLNVDLVFSDQHLELALASGAMAPAMAADFPEVEGFVRLAQSGSNLTFRQGARSHFEKKILYADSTFFEVFDFKLLKGDAQKALDQPNSIVLTERLAEKYFGDQDPVGALLTIDGAPYKVTGLAANPPANTQIGFDGLISWATWARLQPPAETNWGWTNAPTYLLLRPNTDYRALDARLAGWLDQRIPEDQQTEGMKLSLEPLLDVHFNPARLGELKPKGNGKQLLLLLFTGVFVLFMAIFNYINLATALYAGRTREIGVRKTFGAKGKQIAGQFLSESILLAGAAIICSALLTKSALPWFEKLTGNPVQADIFAPAPLAFMALGATLLIGLLAGIYPAVVVTRWQLIHLFRENKQAALGVAGFRRLLTGIQFVISIGLMIGASVIWLQYEFLNQKSLGFDQEEKLVINFGRAPLSHEAVKSELEKLPEVKAVSFSSHVPSEHTHGVFTSVQNKNGEDKTAEMELTLVDTDFLEVYGLQLVAGRNFSRDLATDTTASLILTESAVKLLGFATPGEILGQPFYQWERSGTVIGVIRNYNQHSLHQQISPMTFQMNPALFEKLTVQYRTQDLNTFTRDLETAWQNITAGLPFQFNFLDERLALQYEGERRFSTIFLVFTGLSIFISGIGLFGLTAITVSKRTREIGIRKVLGAAPGNIVALFSKDFVRLVALALIIAAPLAWYFSENWLADFAYRIDLTVWTFAAIAFGAGGIAIFITLFTVGIQTLASAVSNPVKALKNE